MPGLGRGLDLMDFGGDRTSFPRQMKKNVTLYCIVTGSLLTWPLEVWEVINLSWGNTSSAWFLLVAYKSGLKVPSLPNPA